MQDTQTFMDQTSDAAAAGAAAAAQAIAEAHAGESAAPAGPVLPTNPPNQTLYINRLNERTAEAALRESLEQLFSPFGKVLVVSARGRRHAAAVGNLH